MVNVKLRCVNCRDTDLVSTMTRQGVIVDYCPKCGGVWLDKGEIYFFTDAPQYLRQNIWEALKNPKRSQRLNPYTQLPLLELSLFGGKLVIDYCPESEGIWLDKGEMEKIPTSKDIKLNLTIDKGVVEKKGKEPTLVSLPNLGLTSSVTLFVLYGLLTLVLITCVNLGWLEPGVALVLGILVAILQFALSPFLIDLSLKAFYRVRWADVKDLPDHLFEFMDGVIKKEKINFPRIGIIPDGSPNAFTYGHTPKNGRIVITAGLLELLKPEELEAVVAHEIGHIVHWDMLVMTIAYVVPLILYYIFRTLITVRSRGRDRSGPYRYLVAMVSYILYIISQYMVLWFSRVREYFADRFSGETTGDAHSLASALVKIGYGLAGREKKKEEERKPQLEAVKAMGIFDPGTARALAISSYAYGSRMGEEIDKERLKGTMRWDLWNPWALYYQLHSTHPLIAKRLLALSRQAEVQGKEPYVSFDERRPESYWDEFLADLFMKSLPLLVIIGIGIAFVITQNSYWLKFGVILFGFSCLFQIFFSYDFKEFPEFNIASLLKKVKVSAIRPVPCTLRGKIIGRGVPGLIWSEDFVLQDSSGIMFLDYRQPLGIWNFLFGLLRAKEYIGQEVKIGGWYRRAPIPYVEIRTLETDGKKSFCYAFHAKVVLAVAFIVVGLVLTLF